MTNRTETLHLLLLRYLVPEDQTAAHIAGHVEYLERQHARGVFLVSGQTVPSRIGGAIVAAGVDRAEIERIAATDPFVVAGVARYDITTIEPGRISPGLARLSTQSAGRAAAE